MATIPVVYYATNAASGATGTETAITLTRAAGALPTATGVSFNIPKLTTFTIQSIVLGSRGHATPTTQATVFNLRVNPFGAVITTTVPLIMSAQSSTPATALAYDRLQPVFGPNAFTITGGLGLQFGITAAATFTTNAPTWDVFIAGYETS